MNLKVTVDTKGYQLAVSRRLSKLRQAADVAVMESVMAADDDLQNATSTFSHPLKTTLQKQGFADYRLVCYDHRWMFLNRGTKPHPIAAHTPRGMIFAWSRSRKRGEHIAKSRPGLTPGKGRGDSYKSGSSMVSGVPYVSHPGVKARDWTGLLKRKYRKAARLRVLRALRNVP